MRRFWDHATLQPTPHGQQLLLDGKPMRLPEGGTLIINPPALATAIRDEWQNAGTAKDGEFNHANDLPLTQLHTTATHRVAQNRAAIVKSIAAYGESDLLCYRAVSPQLLRTRQDRTWQPWLDWAALHLDAPLLVAEGIAHKAQPAASIAALISAVAKRSDYELAALGVVVPATGSLVLGLALIEGALDAAQADVIATIDEAFQTEFWGIDAEASARIANLTRDIGQAVRFLKLTRRGFNPESN